MRRRLRCAVQGFAPLRRRLGVTAVCTQEVGMVELVVSEESSAVR
jgi:hypothetical protein